MKHTEQQADLGEFYFLETTMELNLFLLPCRCAYDPLITLILWRSLDCLRFISRIPFPSYTHNKQCHILLRAFILLSFLFYFFVHLLNLTFVCVGEVLYPF